MLADVTPTIRGSLGMTVRAQQPEILYSVVIALTVDVIEFKWD
jgi:hypothetical protein